MVGGGGEEEGEKKKIERMDNTDDEDDVDSDYGYDAMRVFTAGLYMWRIRHDQKSPEINTRRYQEAVRQCEYVICHVKMTKIRRIHGYQNEK